MNHEIRQLLDRCKSDFENFKAITILEDGQFSVITARGIHAMDSGEPIHASSRSRTEAVKRITLAVCQAFQVDLDKAAGRYGERKTSAARQVAMFLTREVLGLSYPAVGEAFHKDHGTVIHACKTVQNRLDTEPKFCKIMGELRKQLTEGNE